MNSILEVFKYFYNEYDGYYWLHNAGGGFVNNCPDLKNYTCQNFMNFSSGKREKNSN